MKHPPLYLVSYDIAHSARLARMCRMVKDYAFGRQKSVYECYVSQGSLVELAQRANAIIEPEEDTLFICRVPQPLTTLLLGSATISTVHYLIKIS
ncbi:MAG: CRISPR-associated endonuclease Cas2 [Hahellaceae bacterium]|jgi:CRISPR-associated protein Cas2|nr:CRISPR-associated endonuclease Cas2 [Hahellaceae bacterium]MCP5212264.1 CRISPR-associated endonuclease Cas2 [Hahellaceae bacterium]